MTASTSLIGIVKSMSSIKLSLGRREDVEQQIETILSQPWNHPAEVYRFAYACSARELFDNQSRYLIHHFRSISFSITHSEDNPLLSVSYRVDIPVEHLYNKLKKDKHFVKEEMIQFIQ